MMRLGHSTFLLLFITILFFGCSDKKTLLGKWKISALNLKKNTVLDSSTILVFDPEGYITYNTGSAARGEWEMNTSNSTITISLYGKALQNDLEIKGEYDFSSNTLTITDLKEESKILLVLEKIEPEPEK